MNWAVSKKTSRSCRRTISERGPSCLFQKLESGNPNWGDCNDSVLVMIEDELYMLAGTAASHANEVRETHSIIIYKQIDYFMPCK